MLVHQHSKLQLCADTVCTRNEYGLLDIRNIKLEQTAETADTCKYTGDIGAFNVLFHQTNALVACGNVNACCLVAF